MGYVYVPDVPGQASGYPAPVSDRFTNMRGSNPVQPGTTWGGNQPVAQPTMNASGLSATSNIIWVQGEAEARAYPISPGISLVLLDSEADIFYIKTRDVNGKPQPLQIFDYSERTAASNAPQQTVPQFDPSEYVRWDKLDEYLSERMKRSFRTNKTKEDPADG